MTAHSELDFSPLHVVRKNLTDANRSAYRIYKNPQEYVTVEAATALEAFRESGVKNPLRIVREIRFMERMLDETRFSQEEELVQTVHEEEDDGDGTPPVPPSVAVHEQSPEAGAAYAAAGGVAPAQLAEAGAVGTREAEGQAVEVQSAEPLPQQQVEGEEDSLSPEDVAALLGDSPAN